MIQSVFFDIYVTFAKKDGRKRSHDNHPCPSSKALPNSVISTTSPCLPPAMPGGLSTEWSSLGLFHDTIYCKHVDSLWTGISNLLESHPHLEPEEDLLC